MTLGSASGAAGSSVGRRFVYSYSLAPGLGSSNLVADKIADVNSSSEYFWKLEVDLGYNGH